MKTLCLLICTLALSACGVTVKHEPVRSTVVPPSMPTLKASVRDDCPGLPPIDSLKVDALVKADKASSAAYRICKTRHKTVVEMYLAAQRELDSFIARISRGELIITEK